MKKHHSPVVSSHLPTVFSQSRLRTRPSLSKKAVRLSDLVTVRVLTDNSRLVLQASTLRLLVLQQLPVDYTSREKLGDWLENWQQASHKKLLCVLDVHWNSPEGCVSVVQDYANAGCLRKLLFYMGALPEIVLVEIARSVVTALMQLHSLGLIHGHIDSSQLLLDRGGQVQLAPAVHRRLVGVHAQVSPELDICSLGLTLLEALCGFLPTPNSKSACCLLHSLHSTHTEPLLLRTTVLCHDFICCCLRGCSLGELHQHPWFQQTTFPGPAVDLTELIAVAGRLSMADTLTAGGERELSRISRALEVLDEHFSSDQTIAADLAAELGCSEAQVIERLCK